MSSARSFRPVEEFYTVSTNCQQFDVPGRASSDAPVEVENGSQKRSRESRQTAPRKRVDSEFSLQLSPEFWVGRSVISTRAGAPAGENGLSLCNQTRPHA
jgi:hypothetical protein